VSHLEKILNISRLAAVELVVETLSTVVLTSRDRRITEMADRKIGEGRVQRLTGVTFDEDDPARFGRRPETVLGEP
jgi:hypothetical protein